MSLQRLAFGVRERLRSVGAESALTWLPRSAVASALAILMVLAYHAAFQQRTDLSAMTLAWTLAILFPAMVLAAAPRLGPGRPGGVGTTAFAVALNLGVLLLAVPACLAVWPTDWDAITGWRTYPFLNKRWLGALYAVALLTWLVLPAAIESLFPPAARTPGADASHAPITRRPAWWLAALQVATLVAVAWYLAGPPWNVGGHHRGIDFHEQVHLGPLQAIYKGATPYIGPASTQYGPGFQMALYRYMSVTEQFNLVGFREAFLAIHLFCFAVFAILAWAYAGFATAWLVIVVGAVGSPLKFFTFMADGSLGESYGWGNVARYLGALVVVPALAVLLTRNIERRLASSVVLGFAWGVLAWGAQESLASVITSGALLVCLLWATGSTNRPRVVSTAWMVAAGFALVWLPILGWYFSQGHGPDFVGNYFRIPRAVAAGFQNTWWSDGAADPMWRPFLLTPVFIIVIGVLTVWDPRTWRVRRPLHQDQVRLLSFVCVLAACYQTVLYRSDSLHMLNALIALPFVAVLALRDLPAWLSSGWFGRGAVRLTLVASLLAVYPLGPQLIALYDWVLYPPTYKYNAPAVPARPLASGVAFERATPGLSDEPFVTGEGTGPMRKFLDDASALRRLVGERPTFVHSAAPYFTGLVYFMADLTPAPYLYDVETMLLNDRLQTDAWTHFERILPQVECVIVSSTDAFEARRFLSVNPAARVITHPLGAATVYVIMSGGPDQP